MSYIPSHQPGIHRNPRPIPSTSPRTRLVEMTRDPLPPGYIEVPTVWVAVASPTCSPREEK